MAKLYQNEEDGGDFDDGKKISLYEQMTIKAKRDVFPTNALAKSKKKNKKVIEKTRFIIVFDDIDFSK